MESKSDFLCICMREKNPLTSNERNHRLFKIISFKFEGYKVLLLLLLLTLNVRILL